MAEAGGWMMVGRRRRDDVGDGQVAERRVFNEGVRRTFAFYNLQLTIRKMRGQRFLWVESAYLVLLPGLAIMLIVLAFMLVGNGFRDALDIKENK